MTGGRVLDFGGSAGRVFRHFLYQSTDWEVWTADLKKSSVEWNIEKFDRLNLFAFQSASYPVLPIENNSIDLITAFFAFTHIDETESPWLLELRRIFRRGGFRTFHNKHTWKTMPPSLREACFKFRLHLEEQDKTPIDVMPFTQTATSNITGILFFELKQITRPRYGAKLWRSCKSLSDVSKGASRKSPRQLYQLSDSCFRLNDVKG